MKIVEISSLNAEYEEDVWELLVLTDEEFIPSLSSRNSTQQTDFNADNKCVNRPYAYYEAIKEQEFILAVEEDKVVGLLSYIPDFKLPFCYNDEEIVSNYVSTIIVHPDCRGKKITQKLYKQLMEKNVTITTRTWSGNMAHITILRRLKFDLIQTIPNDRGSGIDTVYYMKKLD